MNIKTFIFKVKRRVISYILFYLWKMKCSQNPNRLETFKLNNGLKFDYPLNSAIGRGLFTKCFEEQERKFIFNNLKSGDIFIDIGANAGIFTIIAAQKIGSSGHVYAFEPGIRELKLLRHNIKINNLKNITIIESAVGNKKGKAKFAISTDGALNSLAETNHHAQNIEKWETVNIITLDEFFQEFQITNANFIKIDVEGAEGLVLEGAKNILESTMSPVIMFECSHLNCNSFGYTVDDIISKLQNQNFLIKYIREDYQLIEVSKNSPDVGNKIYNFVALK